MHNAAVVVSKYHKIFWGKLYFVHGCSRHTRQIAKNYNIGHFLEPQERTIWPTKASSSLSIEIPSTPTWGAHILPFFIL